MHFDSERQYHSASGYVYTTELALEIADIWDGIDRLEHHGISLDAIGRALDHDWEASVIALAQFGRGRP